MESGLQFLPTCNPRHQVHLGPSFQLIISMFFSAIHLPGSVQRRRTKEDQLQMRDFFVEGDLLSAEVQQVKSDGGFALHMRNLKYGKLVTGVLVKVQQVNLLQIKSILLLRVLCGI